MRTGPEGAGGRSRPRLAGPSMVKSGRCRARVRAVGGWSLHQLHASRRCLRNSVRAVSRPRAARRIAFWQGCLRGDEGRAGPILILSGVNRGNNAGRERCFTPARSAGRWRQLCKGFPSIALSAVLSGPDNRKSRQPVRGGSGAQVLETVRGRFWTRRLWDEACLSAVLQREFPPRARQCRRSRG